jgi:signal peptidase I
MSPIRLPSWVLFILDLAKLVIIALVIVWPIHHFVFQPFLVQGPSMEPNFYDKEYLIVEELGYHFSQPQRGEVIVFKSPHNPQDYLIKRVIALPGERVVIKNGEVMIYNNQYPNGVKLKEDYLPAGLNTGGEADQMLKVNQYFVLGDNRQVSLDSRSFGPIARENITGRAWLRGWPLARITKFQIPTYNYVY